MYNNAFITAWIRLAFTPKVGPKTFEKLIKKFKNPAKVLEQTFEVKRRYKLELEPPTIAEIEDVIDKCYHFGGEIILSCDTNNYPELLKETEGFPPVLFAKGNLELLKRPKIAIIGTRNASINGEKITRKIASDLGTNGIVIVSGLARGIDSAAHQSSLETGTIAVIANDINRFCPPENEQLQKALFEKGLVISETPIDSLPVQKNFPRRNRIISGMSSGVLVTEAMRNSGTMITANYALEQGREVFAVPGSPTDPRSYGTNLLIKNGAILVRDAEDIISEFNPTTKPLPKSPTGLEEYLVDDKNASLESQILQKLNNVPIELDELFDALDMPVQEFNKTIIELELIGKVSRKGNKIFTI